MRRIVIAEFSGAEIGRFRVDLDEKHYSRCELNITPHDFYAVARNSLMSRGFNRRTVNAARYRIAECIVAAAEASKHHAGRGGQHAAANDVGSHRLEAP